MLSSLIVGAGCFWGVEVLYEQMPGVINATSGYSGGHLDNPRYEDVLTGETGHVEVVKIDYDSSEVTFNELIDTFFIIVKMKKKLLRAKLKKLIYQASLKTQ